MHLPPPADENELPKCELGCFVEPTIEKKLGLRSSCFTDPERNVTEYVISRNEENGNDVEALDENQADDAISNLNTGMSHRKTCFRTQRSLFSSESEFIDQSFPQCVRFYISMLLVR